MVVDMEPDETMFSRDLVGAEKFPLSQDGEDA